MNSVGATQRHQDRHKSRYRRYMLLLMALTVALWAEDSPAPVNFPSNQQVVAFLTDSIDWYRQRAVERQIATHGVDLVFVEDNRPIARQIVQLSVDFARADASIGTSSAANPNGTAGASRSSSELAHFVQLQTSIELASQQASQKIDEIKKELATARSADRGRLQAALDAAESGVEVLHSASGTVQQLIDFLRGSGDRETGNLVSSIDDLARTVPDVTNPTGKESQTQRADIPLSANLRDSGILALSSEASGLGRKLRILDDQILRTDKLRQVSVVLHTPLLAAINQRVVLDVPNALQLNDLRTLQRQKDQLDQIATSVKTLSPAIVALDKQRILLDAYQSNLKSWRAAVVTEDDKVWKNLILRLCGLALMIGALVVIGAASRKTIRRCVQDSGRRDIMLAIQRVVVWFALVIVAAFSLASDFASMATFFGLLTAGVAVALQSVILCAIGYLVLVGKLGIRTGDRVHISGVTGDLIEIGWLQFQLRQIDSGTQQPTGQVVTFSNSFVFSSAGTGFSRVNRSELNQVQSERAAAKASQLQECDIVFNETQGASHLNAIVTKPRK